MAAGLEVLGHLTILGDDESRLQVEFRGDVVAIELSNLRAALVLRRTLPRVRRRAWLQRVREELVRAGLELQIWVARRQVARLAEDTRSGWVATWLGLDPLELRVRSVLAVLARRSRAPDPSHDAHESRDGWAEPKQ